MGYHSCIYTPIYKGIVSATRIGKALIMSGDHAHDQVYSLKYLKHVLLPMILKTLRQISPIPYKVSISGHPSRAIFPMVPESLLIKSSHLTWEPDQTSRRTSYSLPLCTAGRTMAGRKVQILLITIVLMVLCVSRQQSEGGSITVKSGTTYICINWCCGIVLALVSIVFHSCIHQLCYRC